MQDRNVLASKLKLGQLILKKIIKIVATRCLVRSKFCEFLLSNHFVSVCPLFGDDLRFIQLCSRADIVPI